MFKGSIPAMITPFKDGSVDKEALKAHTDWLIEAGSHGLVPVGTTGESPTLSHEEHEFVIQTVVEQAAGRVPIIAGAGSNNTEEALRFTKFARDIGADGALVVTPYYNKPTQAGLIAHYEALNQVGIPILIYNIPGRSVVDMSPETMGILSKLENIVGVKDATTDLTRINLQRMECGPEFIQVCGDDPLAHGFNAQGGVGCISVTANVAPHLCADLQNACLRGDYGKALEIQDRLMPLHKAIFAEPGLVGAKYGLARLGRIKEEVRLPLVALSPEGKANMDDALRFAGLIN